MAKQTIITYPDVAKDSGLGTPLADAFKMVNDNFNELYTDDTNDVNSIIATAPIARNNATGIVTISLNDNGVDAAKLNVTGNGSNGQALTSDGDGSFSWTTMEVGDITAVTAGAGLTGGGTAGDITLNAIAGNSITVNADSIQVTDSGITATQLASDAVITAKILNANVTADKLASDSVITAKILNDNVTIDKMANDSVGSDELVDNSVGAAALNVSGNGTAGYILKSDGDGSFSWIANDQGDLTAIVAGSGLTGTDLSGPIPTLNIGAGTGITVAADAISLTDGGVTATQLGANSATPAKVSLFDDNTVATDTHILVADGTDYINKAVSGDATLANTGALTIANDAIITAKILDANITVAKMAANSVDSDQYVDGSIDTIHIADDQVTYGKLAPEFTTTDAVTTELDFGGHQVFTKIMGGDTTFTYANVNIGMVKDFILSGPHTPTFPSGTKTVAGTYNASGLNFIQIVAQASGNYWMSISQAQ